MSNPQPWIDRLHAMHVTWLVCLTDSDSFYLQGAAELLLSAGIIPIVRFNPSNLPSHFTQQTATEQLVELYGRHGAPCFIQYLNEPGDSREWRNGHVPLDWWTVWTERWREGARQIIERGAMAVLPDGPCFPKSPFPACSQGIEPYFADGWVAYGSHNYALNRPIAYPRDDAQLYGTPMSEAEYRASLDDLADDPNWQDPPLATINAERARLANPDLTAIDDDTCWRGWEKVEMWMERDLGFLLPHLMCEGGVTPKARAGTGADMELRYTLPTPKKVAERTLEMYNWPGSPFLACCPWLLASEHLGATGWYDDAWFGGAFYDRYGFAKPVAQALMDTLPGAPTGDVAKARALLEGARADIAAAVAALGKP